jgi:hypothetical protein
MALVQALGRSGGRSASARLLTHAEAAAARSSARRAPHALLPHVYKSRRRLGEGWAAVGGEAQPFSQRALQAAAAAAAPAVAAAAGGSQRGSLRGGAALLAAQPPGRLGALTHNPLHWR